MSKEVRNAWAAAVVLGDAELGKLPQHIVAQIFDISVTSLARTLHDIRQRQATLQQAAE
jgi:hypothetical protein